MKQKNPFVIEHNVLIGQYQSEDKDLFFGPLDAQDTFVEFPPQVRFTALLRDLGVFDSISQAKGAGWDKPVPRGFSKYKIERNKDYVRKVHWICILNK